MPHTDHDPLMLPYDTDDETEPGEGPCRRGAPPPAPPRPCRTRMASLLPLLPAVPVAAPPAADVGLISAGAVELAAELLDL